MALTGNVRVAGVVAQSITDGPGLRYTLFLQGCTHRCEGCHNPETHDSGGGQSYTLEEIWAQIKRNPLLSGVTLSGGEPFEQAGQLLELAREIKAAGMELAAYSGYTFEQLCDANGEMLELLRLCDVLVDGRFEIKNRSLSLRFRGSTNQRIIDVQKSLCAQSAVDMRDGRWQD